MELHERLEASAALCRWFDTQDIPVGDASAIMLMVLNIYINMGWIDKQKLWDKNKLIESIMNDMIRDAGI